MKKALAILSAVALVSFAAFAEDAAAAPASLAPTVTGGIDVKAEVNLSSGNTIDSKAIGSLEGTSSAAASKFEPNGLKATGFKTIDWVNFDWSKASIKVEGRYDAWKDTSDDWSYLKTTSTWKDFFGFAIKHEFSVDNKDLKAASGQVDFTKAKNLTNQVTASIAKDAITFSSVYDANDIFGILNLNQTGNKVEQIFTGFRKVSFEYNNDEVYAKLVYKNIKDYTTVTSGTTTTYYDADLTGNNKDLNQGYFESAAIDTAIIEGKKFFGVWTARLNDSGETKLRLGNLDSAGKTDKFEYVIGQDLKIQETSIDDSTTTIDESKKRALNALNTITPIDGLTVKVQAVVPSNTDVAFGNWLAGTYYATEKDIWKDSADKAASNLALDASYVLANVGTINAGTAIASDYLKSTGTVQGNARRMAIVNSTTFPTSAVDNTALWGTAIWAEGKLDKLLGEDGKKAIYVAFDAQFGDVLNRKSILDKASTATSAYLVELTNLSLIRGGVNLETKLANLDGSDKLTVEAGTAIRFGTGYDYKAANATLAGTTVTAASWTDAKTPTGWSDGNYGVNYNEGNDALKTIYKVKNDSPFELKAKVSYALNDTFKSVYVKDEYKALATTADSAIPNAKKVIGWADKNALTLGSVLGVTKNGSLEVSGTYNLFLGAPTADQLYTTGLTDNQKKAVKSAVEAQYGSSSFSPFGLTVSYTIKF